MAGLVTRGPRSVVAHDGFSPLGIFLPHPLVAGALVDVQPLGVPAALRLNRLETTSSCLGFLLGPVALGEHRKAAGIPAGTLHVLRHTAATLALTVGVPVHIVAARLGDDPRTVLATYASLLPQSDEVAAERVAAALADAP